MNDKLITAAVSLKNKIAAMRSNIVEKYVPTFSKSGDIVTCAPAYDNELKIVTTVSTSTDVARLVRCGKNLYNATKYPLATGTITNTSGVYGSTSQAYVATKDFVPVSHLRGQTLILNHPSIESNSSTNMGVAFYVSNDQNTYISGTTAGTFTVPNDAGYMRFTVPNSYATNDAANCAIQIEIGSMVTPYEMFDEVYVEKRFDDPISSGEIEWDIEESFLSPGVNNIYSDAGTTIVSGNVDPFKTLQFANQLIQLD